MMDAILPKNLLFCQVECNEVPDKAAKLGMSCPIEVTNISTGPHTGRYSNMFIQGGTQTCSYLILRKAHVQ
jgi:hypothetical protein